MAVGIFRLGTEDFSGTVGKTTICTNSEAEDMIAHVQVSMQMTYAYVSGSSKYRYGICKVYLMDSGETTEGKIGEFLVKVSDSSGFQESAETFTIRGVLIPENYSIKAETVLSSLESGLEATFTTTVTAFGYGENKITTR